MESDVPREMGLEEVRDPEIVKQERQLKERYPNVGREGNKIIVPLDGTEVHIGLFDREQDGGYSIDFKGKTVVFSDAFFESEPKYLATGRVRTLAPLVFMQTLNINEAMGVPMRQK